ncbi:MAG: alpha-amylase family glycosyl hydrolase [Gammaproteobacteria bacterium]|jgi:pullulanase/glycogen debranching enzyme
MAKVSMDERQRAKVDKKISLSELVEQAELLDESGALLRLGSDRWLGASVRGDTTVFRLFAPRAAVVRVFFFRHLDSPEPKVQRLSRLDSGVWEASYPANLHGWYYYYRLDSLDQDAFSHFDGEFRILDPYAVATVGPGGPGIIWDRRRLKRDEPSFQPPCWHDLVVLEAHVRDLIRYAPVPLEDEERLGFTGLQRWVEAQGSYLRSLGVNAVELLPVQQFGGCDSRDDYHWGYMSVNFFSPESSYAMVPELGSQVEEFRALVAAFHHQGIAVIMDVVYNHSGDPNHLLFIDKHYYFQLDKSGNLSNWSGCGNDLRCDTPMGRRLIIDSLIHFIETYDIDGFRFDLAELIGVKVLKEIEAALKSVKPSVILIAEPWSFRGHIALALKSSGFASWNDGYREFLRDYIMGQGNQAGLRYFMAGSLAHLSAWPAQSVNYVESHDDLCWIDKITENPHHRGDHPTANDRRRTHLMLAVLMCSLGIPMLSAGQDTLRTKRGINNSYRAPEENAIDYHRLLVFSGSHEYFRRWIRFRLSESGRLFRLDSPPSDDYFRYFGAAQGSAMAVLFNADYSKGQHRLLFAINPHHETVHLSLEDIDVTQWRQLADHERFEPGGLTSARLPCTGGRLELPPLSCALWQG